MADEITVIQATIEAAQIQKWGTIWGGSDRWYCNCSRCVFLVENIFAFAKRSKTCGDKEKCISRAS